MKIKNVTDDFIEFDNGNKITYEHEPDCCEYNYADFSILNKNNINYSLNFNPELTFDFIDGMGFRFGSEDEAGNMRWIFIPCYSDQNGYYSSDIDIYYNDKCVLHGECEEHVF